MGYWKWLGELLKPASVWRTVKSIARAPLTEWLAGYIGAFAFLMSGIICGTGTNSHYALLSLGIIPSLLILAHGVYRMRQGR